MATIPPSCPVRSATPRIGVSARRFRKPVWMSRARSVPAFIVAKSAPWMNGMASAKATNELVGNPGRRVAASSPPALTARSRSGKTSGKTMLAGCRTVRTTERCARVRTWPAKTLLIERRSRPLERQLGRGSLFLLVPRPFQRAAGLGEEDVVERGLVELEMLDLEVFGVEGAHDLGQIGLTGTQSYGDSLGRRPAGFAEASEDRGGPVKLLGIGRDDLDGRTPDLGLQLGRRSLGDDLAVVDDPHPIGERVGLLQVLGREEDRHPLVPGEALHLRPEGQTALDVETGGGLVEEEDARLVDEREREVEPALHPARV